VALVTPWFGAALTGGAERLAWQVARGLHERGHAIEVFTTCAASFASDWGAAAYPAGAREEGGVTVYRFPVDERAADAFDRANEILLGRPLAYYRERAAAIEHDVARDFMRDGINSSAAIAALQDALPQLDAVLVLPYPYGLTLDAVEAAGRRAMFQPCLHDEPYAYLPAVDDACRGAGVLLFNSVAERSLASRLYGPAIGLKSVVVGHWVEDDAAPAPRPERVRGFRPADHRYLLYLGRRDTVKNVDLLVESFARFRRHARLSTLQLVLVGPGTRSFADERHGIRDLGPVSDVEKRALLERAEALVQPSVNESFSRVVMESWSAAKPVVVNGRCAATADAVRESGGGWIATTKADWSERFELLDRLPGAERAAAGERGRTFYTEQTSRERILDRYETAIGALVRGRAPSAFDTRVAPALVHRLNDGPRTVLYAGPLTEAASLDDVLAGFGFLVALGIDARLVLVGALEGPAVERFYELVARLQLAERIVVLDSSRPDVVAAAYRCADLFWSAAGEGPADALTDALGFGVPIFAYANDGVRRLLGEAGILYNDKRDPRALAGVAALLLTDRVLRETVLDGQRRRFEALQRNDERTRVG
jgi:glycosyltransferase involved in cell wall biosynthesis